MLFDAHTHLNFEEMTAEEREKLAEEIEASELGYMIDAGDSVKSSELAIEDSHKYPWCYAAAGIHPQNASVATDRDVEAIERLAQDPRVKAIGEIGLDFYYGKDDRDEQISLFRKQIRLANRLRMPIMIHTRDANRLTQDILTEEGAFSDERRSWFPKRPDGRGGETADARVQLHCYSGSAEQALDYVRLGATISIGGAVTFKNGRKTVEVVRAVPLEFLLSETDAPYMAPEPLRGRPNKPYYVEHVVRRIAVLKEMTFEETAAVLLCNGMRFFGIDGDDGMPSGEI